MYADLSKIKAVAVNAWAVGKFTVTKIKPNKPLTNINAVRNYAVRFLKRDTE